VSMTVVGPVEVISGKSCWVPCSLFLLRTSLVPKPGCGCVSIGSGAECSQDRHALEYGVSECVVLHEWAQAMGTVVGWQI
jgi:hypothetical protein